MNETLWWEKSVEYAFLIRVVRERQTDFVVPLDGDVEQIGDTIFGASSRWVIIEFKGKATDIAREEEKYGTRIDEVQSARAARRTLAEVRAKLGRAERILAEHTESGNDVERAGSQELVDSLTVELAQLVADFKKQSATARTKQKEAYDKAAESLRDSGAAFHFLVYAGPVPQESESSSVDPSGIAAQQTLASARLDLHMRQYFSGDSTSQRIDTLDKILPAPGDPRLGADGPALEGYLKALISFKQTGEASGGDTTDEGNVYRGQAASLVGLNAEGKLIVLPLENVWAPLIALTRKKQAKLGKSSQPGGVG